MIDKRLHIDYNETELMALQYDYDLYYIAIDIVNELKHHRKDIYKLYLNADEEDKYNFLIEAAEYTDAQIDIEDVNRKDAIYSAIDDYKCYLTGEFEDE